MFVRVAGDDDVDSIVSLVAAAHAELGPERGGETWTQSEARPAPFRLSVIADMASNAHVVVAGIDDVVLGVAITKTRTRHDGRLVAHVGELIVDPPARGIGLGASLLDDATVWAARVGAVGIESVALPGQRATKNFFEAAGMKARLLTVFRDLTEPEIPSSAKGPDGD